MPEILPVVLIVVAVVLGLIVLMLSANHMDKKALQKKRTLPIETKSPRQSKHKPAEEMPLYPPPIKPIDGPSVANSSKYSYPPSEADGVTGMYDIRGETTYRGITGFSDDSGVTGYSGGGTTGAHDSEATDPHEKE